MKYFILVSVLLTTGCVSENSSGLERKSGFDAEEITNYIQPDESSLDTISSYLFDRVEKSSYYSNLNKKYSNDGNKNLSFWMAPEGSQYDSLVHFQIIMDLPSRVVIVSDLFYSHESGNIYEMNNESEEFYLMDIPPND